jgi:hypothetical protein
MFVSRGFACSGEEIPNAREFPQRRVEVEGSVHVASIPQEKRVVETRHGFNCPLDGNEP